MNNDGPVISPIRIGCRPTPQKPGDWNENTDSEPEHIRGIHPVNSQSWGGGQVASNEVVSLNPSSGPRSIESVYDELLSCGPCPDVLIARQAEFDGVIIACYGNHPVIHAAREMLTQPVVDIMEASLYLACVAGHTFSVISSGDRAVAMFWDAIRSLVLRTAAPRSVPRTPRSWPSRDHGRER